MFRFNYHVSPWIRNHHHVRSLDLIDAQDELRESLWRPPLRAIDPWAAARDLRSKGIPDLHPDY